MLFEMMFQQENLVTSVSMLRELIFKRLLVILRLTETRCFRVKSDLLLQPRTL